MASTSIFGEKERTIAIRPGLEILFGDFRLVEPRQFHFKTSGDTCHFAFVLSGMIVNRLSCLAEDIVVTPRQAAFWLTPEVYAVHDCNADEDIRFICIRMRRSMLAEIVRDDLDRLPAQVRVLLEQRDDGIYYSCSTMSDQMLHVAQEFFECPYQGATEKLFLEAKALELASHFMAGILNPDWSADACKERSGDERIQHAQRILLDSMAQPPSLSELARMTGLSEASLTRGFRKATGMSPFAFLRIQRLEKARTLLESTTMNITEVAYFVGFSNPSHLTRLFNERFKMTPGAYRQAHHS